MFAVTNLATGKTFRGQFAGVEKDHSVIDNGDGTLTIEVLATGAEKWYADNRLVLRAPGQVRFEILIDHAGTPTDHTDDEFIEFLGLTKGSTGTNDTEGRDFCEDVHLFTT